MAESDLQATKKVKVKRDLTGERFERLLVIEQADDYISRTGGCYAQWLCLCDCGERRIVRGDCLKNGLTKSCGCYNSDSTATRNEKHGCNKKGKRSRIYNIWAQMISRCSYKNRWDYKHYGGRGIKVCDEWLDFSTFKNWADKTGYSDSLTLDRIDPDGGYTPDNCRWATVREQQNNRRNNHYMTYNGETHSMADWARVTGITYSTLRSRKNNLGWSDEKSITTPLKGTDVSFKPTASVVSSERAINRML